MSSSRSKLMLDEQSFQGLLAAAFTIQQHNDRQKVAGSNSTVGGEEVPPQPSADCCRDCGEPIPAGRAACPKCADKFRPGERLQRTWASMWMMSQGKSLEPDWGLEDREKPGPDAQPFPSRAGGDRADPHPASAPPIAKRPPAGPEGTGQVEKRGDLVRFAASNALGRQNNLPISDLTIEDRAVADAAPQGLASDDLGVEGVHFDISAAHDLPVDDPPALAPSSNTGAIDRGFLDLRVKLRFHRADLYLGVAVVVAFLALLWPATASQRPKLRPWERMMVAIGIAEAPPPAVHYPGDPNIKVWVDTHTALYYCPGEELYGKSQDGHYSTQREAQLDRFEPAERVACVE